MGFSNSNKDRIQPCAANPAYWQYRGAPVLLIGGSVEDNLFQLPDIADQLDLLESCGGNFVRCTMSSRDEGNVWPFERDAATGFYDLERPSAEFWRRFETFLKLAYRHDIFIQFEIWATFDFYRDCWDANPFNPKNNNAYSAEESGLPVVVDSHPTKTKNPFFWSVPEEHNNTVILKYQQAFVDKMLSYSLDYGNVLYCMDNETSVTPRWGAYWSEYVRARAAERGLMVETTEMWDAHDLSDRQHGNTFEHPETYSFVDVSQNNHQKGQAHWDNAQKQRERIRRAGHIRPMTNVKIYGADTGRFGDDRDGQERFWRNIFGGMASARFHRPGSGLGISDKARAHIRSVRMITDELDIPRCEPHNDLLSGRGDNAAYCFAQPGKAYAVFFPKSDGINLDCSAVKGDVVVRWLDIMASRWAEPETVPATCAMPLIPPSAGFHAVLVRGA
ncbi:MAG: hypothetical protein JW909_03130 [Planctomycetes bacterium]|nr:hypothetical protein [Planctomycetota bacterium]